MKNSQSDKKPSRKSHVPYKLRLWVRFKPENQKNDRHTGKARETWFWNSDWLQEKCFKKYNRRLSVYKAIQNQFSLIKDNCNDIRVYDSTLKDGPLLYHWTMETGLIINEMRLMSYKEEDNLKKTEGI